MSELSKRPSPKRSESESASGSTAPVNEALQGLVDARPARHAFVGVLAPRGLANDLARLQSDLRGVAPGFTAIPRRWLHLTLDDLGPTDPAAIEAVTLAVQRAVQAHGRCTLRSRGWVQAGSILALQFDDPKDRLGALRATVHEGLRAYGFAVDARRFRPHIALGRTSTEGVDLAALPAPGLSLTVDRVDVVQHSAEAWGPAWQIVRTVALDAASPAAEPVDEAVQIDAIRTALRARVTERVAEREALRARQARQARNRPEPSPDRDDAAPRKRRRRGRSSAHPSQSQSAAPERSAERARPRATESESTDAKPQRSRRRRRRRGGARPATPRKES